MLLRTLTSLLFVLVCVAYAHGVPRIDKVEPPNWWVGHSIETVRVVVRGEGLQNAQVESKIPNLKISNLRINERGDYAFFDVAISKDTKAGKYSFDLKTTSGNTIIPFEISAPLGSQSKNRGLTNDDIIYLIMTDRFADGDQSNNKDVDRSNPRAWHGGDFRGIVSKLDYLKELGITAIWLTPWYDNPDEPNLCSEAWCPYTNYHGYHAVDYYAVENHFGSMADLQMLVREANKKGIKVIQDQVANHVGVQHPWAKSPPLPNWFSQFSKNSFNNSVLLSPNASQAERDNLIKGWFNELLPDLNQDEPEVSKYLIQNALWWAGMTGIDGIRQDTIQYMPRSFIRDWSIAIVKQYPKFYLVGEVFEEDSAQTAFFQGGRSGWDGIDTRLPSVFDFKLWRTSQEVFTGKKPARALRDVLKYDGLYPNINYVTTLTNNHDTDRFMSLPGATLEGAMLHTAFILSTRGIPQLYYGEEIAMTGGHDPDNRKDFPEGAFINNGRTADAERLYEWTRKWIAARKSSPALMRGNTTDLFYDKEAYVFERRIQLVDWTVVNLVAFNASNQVKEFEIEYSVPKQIALERVKLEPVVSSGETIEAVSNKLKLRMPPKSAFVYEVRPQR